MSARGTRSKKIALIVGLMKPIPRPATTLQAMISHKGAPKASAR